MTFVHPKAHVEGAQLGEDVKVFQFASVFGGAVIGDRTVVGPCAMINGSRIGADCKVSWGVNMGPGFLVGDRVFLGPGMVLCNVRWPWVDKAGFDVGEFDGTKWAVIIEDDASIGAYATILPGVRIGRNAMVAAQACASRDVPDNHIIYADGHIEPIEDEGVKLRRRMKFAQPARRPFEGESLPHVAALDREQEALLESVGIRADQIA